MSMVTATCLPPDISGLYLSASLTPSAAYSLSINVSMRLSVAAFAAAGGVIYAEEAGLAYLASSVRFAGDTFGMAGVLPMHVIMHEEKQARSYVRLRVQPPPQDQEPLLHPGEWMRGVADTTLEVREEVATRGLSLRTRHISDMKVSQLFEAVLVDVSLPSDVHASGSGAKKNESDQSHKVRASPVHGFDTVREGYMQSKVAATLVHVCFASQASAVQPLVAACAALDSQSLTAGAAQHIANSQRSNSSSRTSSVRMRKSLPQSGSEGCLTQLAHPLVRLSGDHSPPSPRYLTPSASAVSMNFSLSPGLDRASNGARQSRSLPRALGLPPVTPAAGCGHGDSDVSRGMSMGHDSMSASGGGNQPRPGWGAPGIARWGSIPESLFQGQQGAPPPQSQGGSAPGSHSTMRSAAQWWMPPQPLPRVRVLSGRDLTVYDAGTRLPEASGMLLRWQHAVVLSLSSPPYELLFHPTSICLVLPMLLSVFLQLIIAQLCIAASVSSLPLTPVPMLSQPASYVGRELSTNQQDLSLCSGSRQSRSSGAMDCAAAALHHSTNRHNSEERSAPAPAATSTGDILGLSKEPSCSSSSSVHSLSLQERGATSSHCQHTGVRSQIAALSPSIADILHHLGLGNTLGGVPADCTAAKPHIRDRDWSHSHSLARTSAGSSSAGAGGSGAVRTVISLVNNLTDSPAVNGHSHTYPASQKPGNKQLHRRASSGDSKASLGAWRNVARRVVMDVRDWQPLHVLHTDQIAALVAPMVLTWEPERCFSSKRGGVLPAIEAAHAGVLEHLRHMEVPVDIVTLPAPRCIGDMYSTVQCMGTILRATAAAEATTAHMRAGMHRLAQLCFRPSLKPAPSSTSCAQLQQRQQPRKVVMLRSAAPYIVAGGWLPELVRMSGATYACVFPGEGALGVEWSDIAAQEPDVIIVVVEMVGVQSAALELAVLAEEPGWWSLKATRNREVYVVDASHLLQVGPGVVNAAETVVRMCRPDLRGELGDSESRGDRDDRVLKLEMTAGQRCRPSLLPSFFTPVPW